MKIANSTPREIRLAQLLHGIWSGHIDACSAEWGRQMFDFSYSTSSQPLKDCLVRENLYYDYWVTSESLDLSSLHPVFCTAGWVLCAYSFSAV